jgi:hypothetical protein
VLVAGEGVASPVRLRNPRSGRAGSVAGAGGGSVSALGTRLVGVRRVGNGGGGSFSPSVAPVAAGDAGDRGVLPSVIGRGVPPTGAGVAGVRSDASGGVRSDDDGEGVRSDVGGTGVRSDADGEGVRSEIGGAGVRSDAGGEEMSLVAVDPVIPGRSCRSSFTGSGVAGAMPTALGGGGSGIRSAPEAVAGGAGGVGDVEEPAGGGSVPGVEVEVPGVAVVEVPGAGVAAPARGFREPIKSVKSLSGVSRRAGPAAG